jgi:hypothetical protein
LRGAINNPGETFFYCAPTYRMAKDIAWKVLKKLVPKPWIKTKNETDLKLELVNGSTIELKGTENAMALRGRSLSGVVLDEAAFMDAEVWFEVIRPALADKQGWALFISTPDGTASWFYDLWCYCEDDPTNEWKRWCYTTIQGGNVPAACPDPTGGARKTSGVGVTDHAILRRSGFTVQSPRSPWKIRDKITAINTGLMDASGARRVKIHPRCKELIKSLRTLTYAPGTGLPNKNLGVDHAFDAFGYLVLQQFNLAKPEAMGTTSYRLY